MALNIDQILSYTLYGNTGRDYLVALVIFIFVYASLKIFKRYLLARLRQIAKKTKNDIDDAIIEFIDGIKWPFYIFLSVYAAIECLVLHDNINQIAHYALLIFTVFYSVKIIQKIVDYAIRKRMQKTKDKEKDSLLLILNKIINATLWIIAVLLVLSNLGLNITSLIASLGIGGIAIAFALQRILEDIFSSFSIYFDKPFEVGDYIVIGEDKGVVQHIGLKTTRIKHLQGQEVVVSNRELTSTRIHNYKKMKERRIAFTFGVEYCTSQKKLKIVKNTVTKIIKDIDLARLDRVHFSQFGDSALIYEVVYYLDNTEYNVYMDIQEKINVQLKEEFEKQGIQFAYPTQTIYIKK
ncbi:mechanosensitive ion channel family protein [Candidatus Woesearchaeota archaeon]|nr:mechanosensitive ion channel family protein [Candidatus Woesearchaeota archaeon]